MTSVLVLLMLLESLEKSLFVQGFSVAELDLLYNLTTS